MSQKLIGNTESRWKTFLKTKAIYIAMAITVLGLFGGIPSMFFLYSKTLIGFGELLILFSVCAVLGLLQWKYLKNILGIEYINFVMYAFSGFGMCLMSFLLFINYFVIVSSSEQTYTVEQVSVHYGEFDIILSEDVSSETERVISGYATENFQVLGANNIIKVELKKGLLGLTTIRKCVIVH